MKGMAQPPLPSPSPSVKAPSAEEASMLALPSVKGTIAKAPDSKDGKVSGLNAAVYDTLDTIHRANPGALTTKNAMTLRESIIKDDQVDALEADLLAELTQSQFRSVTVTKAGAAENAPKLTRYPCSGAAKTVLQVTLDPQLNLADAWTKGIAGWKDIVLASQKNPREEQRVSTYLQERVAQAWEASNQSNGYKPFRDMIAQRYGYTKAPTFPADQANHARKLMIDACTAVDRISGDKMPDFLYTWWTASAFQ